MNPVQGWIKIIGSVENARKLRKLLARLDEARFEDVPVYGINGLPTLILHQRVPGMCPSRLLHGQKASEQMYLDPELRPALDAWDNGTIDAHYLRKLTFEIDGERMNPQTRSRNAKVSKNP